MKSVDAIVISFKQTMAKLSHPSGLSKIEGLLLRHSVICKRFSENDNQKVDTAHNNRRLLLLAISTVIFIRFMIILLIPIADTFNWLGDVLWTLGVVGYFMNALCALLTLILIWYLVAVMYCECHCQLGFLNDLSVATKTKSAYSVALESKIQLLFKIVVINAYVIPYVNGAEYARGMLMKLTVHFHKCCTMLLSMCVFLSGQIPLQWLCSACRFLSTCQQL